nr:hypothetical protein [uncultured Chryseobacterium sp.]
MEKNTNYMESSKSDSELYDLLDSLLEKENTDCFSLGFSKNIIRKIEAKKQRGFNLKIYILISILAVVSIPLFVSFLNTEFISILFSVLLKYKFIFIFLVIMVILIQFGEKLLNPGKDIH